MVLLRARPSLDPKRQTQISLRLLTHHRSLSKTKLQGLVMRVREHHGATLVVAGPMTVMIGRKQAFANVVSHANLSMRGFYSVVAVASTVVIRAVISRPANVLADELTPTRTGTKPIIINAEKKRVGVPTRAM